MPTERDLIRDIQIAVSKTGARVFRQNVGFGWTGIVAHSRNMLTIRNPRPLHAGLCKGSSDLIGWTADGRFLAIEVKTGKQKPTQEQQNFIDQVKAAGGVAGVARSVSDAVKLLDIVPHRKI